MVSGFYNLSKCFEDNFKSDYSLTAFYRKTKNIDVIIITNKKIKLNYYINFHNSYPIKVKDSIIDYNNTQIGLYKNLILNIPLYEDQFNDLLKLDSDNFRKIDFLYNYNLREWMI
jgi:hypothetical protein